MRHCPDCAQPLAVFHDGAVELDGCARCGGVFYDFRELSARLGQEVERWLEGGLAFPLGVSSRRCPAHGADALLMDTYRFDDAGGLEIEVCKDCKGVWLDGGEEESLREFSAVLERSWAWLSGDSDGAVELAMFESSPLASLARMRGVRRKAVLPWLLAGLMLVLVIGTMFEPAWFATFGFTPQRWTASPWTLVTYGFLHDGLGHWINNMVIAVFVGIPLVLYLGRAKFVLLTALTIVAGALAQWAVYPMSELPLVGFSAACLGFLGALIVIMPKVRVGAARRGLTVRAGVVAVLVVVQQVGYAFLFDMLHVAWTSHLAGFAVGALAGLLWRDRPSTR